MNLDDCVNQVPTFTPHSRYCREFDCLEIFLGDDDAYAERVDGMLTMYWSEADDDALMGCEINRLLALVAEAEAVGIEITRSGKLRLSALIAAYQCLYPGQIPVRTYNKLMRFAREQGQALEVGQPP